MHTDLCHNHGGAPGSGGNPPGLENGGGGDGRPIEHGLYSMMLTEDADRERYEYYKSDPNYLSVAPEIAVMQLNLDRFIKNHGGSLERMRADARELANHQVDIIRRLKESENKRLYQEQLIEVFIQERTAALIECIAEAIDEHIPDQSVKTRVCETARGHLANRCGAGLRAGENRDTETE